MVKKLICLCFCALMTALCAVCAYADPPTANAVEVNGLVGFFGYDNAYQRFTSRSGFYPAPHTGSVYKSYTASAQQFPMFLFAYTEETPTETNNTPSAFASNYTYYFTGTLKVGWSVNYIADNGQGPTIYLSEEAAEAYFGTSSNINTSDTFGYFVSADNSSNAFDNYNLGFGSPSVFTEGSTSYCEVDFSVVFHVLENPSYLAYSFCIYYPDIGDISMGQNRSYSMDNTSCTVYYDPTGDVAEEITDTDEIIQGQKDAVDYGLNQERDAVDESGNSSFDNSRRQAETTFNLENFRNALGRFASSLAYTGTDYHFYFPDSGDVPFIGHLWDRQLIPIQEYLSRIPIPILMIVRFLAWLGLLFSCVYQIRTLIDDINGGEN